MVRVHGVRASSRASSWWASMTTCAALATSAISARSAATQRPNCSSSSHDTSRVSRSLCAPAPSASTSADAAGGTGSVDLSSSEKERCGPAATGLPLAMACRTCRLKICVSCPTHSSTMSSIGTVRADDAFGLKSLELLMSFEATWPAQPSERSSAERTSFSLCGCPLRPYLVTPTPCLSRRMPSSAVADRTEFVGCTAIPVPRPRERCGAATAGGGVATAPMGKDQSTAASSSSVVVRRLGIMPESGLMCVECGMQHTRQEGGRQKAHKTSSTQKARFNPSRRIPSRINCSVRQG